MVQLLSGSADDSIKPLTREEFLQLVREDSTLPESIQPAAIPACKPSEIKTLLVTGATGNMGPYFLKELAQRPHIQKIYCLVRDDKVSNGKRLEKKLMAKGLLDQVKRRYAIILKNFILDF